MNLVSAATFHWINTALLGGVSVAWWIYDAINLARLRGDRADPLVRDKQFGFVMGLVIATIGVVRTLRYNGVM